MNRRTFTRLSVAPWALAAAPRALLGLNPSRPGELARHGSPPGGDRHSPHDAGSTTDPAGGSFQDLRVDGTRLNRRLDELRRFGGTPEGGTHRVAYSDEDITARAWVAGRMEEAGLDVSVDLAGNLIGRVAGTESSASPILLGSHIDSVPSGGNYDGQVGSMGALEVAATLEAAGHRTRHPLEYVIWANEEGGKTGSRVLIDKVASNELEIVTASGYTIAEGTRRLGGDPARWSDAHREPGSVTAYFELHIEQGFVLDRGGIDIGVVEGIVGIKRWTVTVDGFANHAGTTPMNQRQDAMVTAARIIHNVNRIARETPGRQVATVGRLEAEPGAPNVVPGRAIFTLEIRDLVMGKVDSVFDQIRESAEIIANTDGTTVGFEQFYQSDEAPTDPRLRDVIEAEANRLELSSLRMPSGAGHDAQSVAILGPVGMIFVPSREGISHSPLEYTAPEHVAAGANVLLRSLLAVDQTGLG